MVLTFTILHFYLGLGLISITKNGKNINDLAQAYTDNSLFENAFEKAKTNQRVIAILGDIEPIDKLAILEGYTKYSNNNNSVDLTVRIIGNKGNGKLDVSAVKNGATWEYRKINVRIKQTQEEIQIIKTKL